MSIFFSRNVKAEIKDLIIQKSGFSTTSDLGMYLGLPLIHKKVTNHTFKHILKKVQDKLVGWKTNCLSMDRKIVFTKLVTGGLPIYTMQVIAIPTQTLKEIERY